MRQGLECVRGWGLGDGSGGETLLPSKPLSLAKIFRNLGCPRVNPKYVFALKAQTFIFKVVKTLLLKIIQWADHQVKT